MTIAAVRIAGQAKLNRDVIETLDRLRVKRKYACVIIPEDKKEIVGMVKKMKDFVAYGEISDEILTKLIEKRAISLEKGKKVDVKKAVELLKSGENKDKLAIKPFFRLHPPRGGIDSKIHFGKKKGVLGDNGKDINKLIDRML